MLDIFPNFVESALSCLDYKGLQELRLRVGKPATVCYFSKYYYLGENGLMQHKKQALILDAGDLENIIFKASNFSVYAVNEDIKKGFISLSSGIRIGIVGQVVSENDKVLTIKNFSSLNIRFPHEIKGSSEKIIDKLIENGEFLNTLILSKPSAGKTTLARDIIRQISGIKLTKNVLVVDERNELSGFHNGECGLDVGDFSDVIVDCNKSYAFSNGIRSMSPDVIVTDEIGSKQDCDGIFHATSCGVKLLATIHSNDLKQLFLKPDFATILQKKVFERYVVLSNRLGKGTIEGVYDENLNPIL